MEDRFFVKEPDGLHEITPESGEYIAGERDVLVRHGNSWYLLKYSGKNLYEKTRGYGSKSFKRIELKNEIIPRVVKTIPQNKIEVVAQW